MVCHLLQVLGRSKQLYTMVDSPTCVDMTNNYLAQMAQCLFTNPGLGVLNHIFGNITSCNTLLASPILHGISRGTITIPNAILHCAGGLLGTGIILAMHSSLSTVAVCCAIFVQPFITDLSIVKCINESTADLLVLRGISVINISTSLQKLKAPPFEDWCLSKRHILSLSAK